MEGEIGSLGPPIVEYEIVARKTAISLDLDPALVCAMCEQESSWNPWEPRWEPGFYHRYVEPIIVPQHLSPTEAQLRSFSWGLMQVMGQTAREFGWTGPILRLVDPANGVEMGCKKLLDCLSRTNGDVHSALQRYNGGSDPSYADEVAEKMKKYQGEEAPANA